jgi:hypothetical protein
MSEAIKGRVYMNNGIITKMVKPQEVDYYLNNGFTYGRFINKKERS